VIEQAIRAALAAKSPCDSCRFAARCSSELLACERYSMYAAGEPERRWRSAPMAPTRARFEALHEA
jgi:hypothetical protein